MKVTNPVPKQTTVVFRASARGRSQLKPQKLVVDLYTEEVFNSPTMPVQAPTDQRRIFARGSFFFLKKKKRGQRGSRESCF